jgi:hypothetical protein
MRAWRQKATESNHLASLAILSVELISFVLEKGKLQLISSPRVINQDVTIEQLQQRQTNPTKPRIFVEFHLQLEAIREITLEGQSSHW